MATFLIAVSHRVLWLIAADHFLMKFKSVVPVESRITSSYHAASLSTVLPPFDHQLVPAWKALHAGRGPIRKGDNGPQHRSQMRVANTEHTFGTKQ